MAQQTGKKKKGGKEERMGSCITGYIYQTFTRKGEKSRRYWKSDLYLNSSQNQWSHPLCQALTKETHQYEHRKERIELPDPGLKGLIIKALSRSC